MITFNLWRIKASFGVWIKELRKLLKTLKYLLNLLALVAKPRQCITGIKMEKSNCKESCQKSDLIVNVKARNVGRFKAGAELSGKVNIMNVEVIEEIGDNFQDLHVKLHLSSEVCAEK